MKRSTIQRGGVSVAALSLVLGLAACGSDNAKGADSGTGTESSGEALTGTLTASGASSQESAMTSWIAGYADKQSEVTVNYDAIGSGGGRENLISGAIDFAGSDAALDEEERAAVTKSCGPDGAMNIPVYISPVAVPYNVEGVDTLQLKPDTLAKIFDQKIKTWDDAAIKADNPDVELPRS